jgi:hypothetical protein
MAQNPAAHGMEKYFRERIGLELGRFSGWRQDVAGPMADTLQAQELITMTLARFAFTIVPTSFQTEHSAAVPCF